MTEFPQKCWPPAELSSGYSPARYDTQPRRRIQNYSPQCTTIEALSYFEKGQYGHAAQLLGIEAARSPHSARPHFWLGRCHFQLRDFEKAVASFTTCLEMLAARETLAGRQASAQPGSTAQLVMQIDDLMDKFTSSWPTTPVSRRRDWMSPTSRSVPEWASVSQVPVRSNSRDADLVDFSRAEVLQYLEVSRKAWRHRMRSGSLSARALRDNALVNRLLIGVAFAMMLLVGWVPGMHRAGKRVWNSSGGQSIRMAVAKFFRVNVQMPLWAVAALMATLVFVSWLWWTHPPECLPQKGFWRSSLESVHQMASVVTEFIRSCWPEFKPAPPGADGELD